MEEPYTPAPNTQAARIDYAKKTEKAPLIVIRNREKWIMVNSLLTSNHVQIIKAKTFNGAIRVQTSNADNFRIAVKALNQHKLEYHT